MASSTQYPHRSAGGGMWPAWGAAAVAPGVYAPRADGLSGASGKDVVWRRFFLKSKDISLATFVLARHGQHGWMCQVEDVSDACSYLSPLGMELTGQGVLGWLKARLKTDALDEALAATLGLSLLDCHWVVPEGHHGAWDAVNLFDHGDSAWIERELGKIYVLSEASPMRAMQLYRAACDADLAAAPCSLVQRQGRLCVRRLLMTDKNRSFVPLRQCFPRKSLEDIGAALLSMGESFHRDFIKRRMFDALHPDISPDGMGLMVDNHLNKPYRFAPFGVGA